MGMRETVASIPVAIFRVPLNLPTSPLIERKPRGPFTSGTIPQGEQNSPL